VTEAFRVPVPSPSCSANSHLLRRPSTLIPTMITNLATITTITLHWPVTTTGHC